MEERKQHSENNTEILKELPKLKKQILKKIKEFYFDSGDFNGLPVSNLYSDNQIKEKELKKIIEILIKDEKIILLYGDSHPNPNIKAFSDESPKDQIEKLSKFSINHACAYPTRKYLIQVVNPNDFHGKPYELEIALGAGKLEYKSFDLSILEIYRNDPRYYFDNDDISGNICINDDFFESKNIPQSDQILLQSFGFSYDEDWNRAVAVFLVYLSKLSPEHQQIWRAKELKGLFKLHPDYYRNSILGEIGEKLSIFDAFIEELRLINEMCTLIGKPNLFRNTFISEKPNHFSFLIRPTLYEFNSFILILDQMMSDNINKNFFKGEISDEVDEKRKDGKIIVRQKGTIQLLEEWLNKYVKSIDRKPMNDLISVFRSVRNKRQKPAHSIKPNEFNQEYFRQQRELIIKAYGGIRTMRLILANHPNVKSANIQIIKPLFEGKIWTF